MMKLYLSENRFTGEIPSSTLGLPKLKELKLDRNGFSGRIPDFQQTNLRVVNLSDNELEGPIPDKLRKMDSTMFSEQSPTPVIVAKIVGGGVGEWKLRVFVQGGDTEGADDGGEELGRSSPLSPGSAAAATRLANTTEHSEGVAKGLDHLYKELPHLIAPHGHLKSSNVLLNQSLQPLLTDYSLIPVINQENAQELMVAYKSPEHIKSGRITKKTDVWSLGVLILEVLTAKFPSNFLQKGKGKDDQDLAVFVKSIVGDDPDDYGSKIDLILDKEIGGISDGDRELIAELLRIGLSCCESDVEKRLDLKMATERIEGLKVEDDFPKSH
ncbi:Pollen receptor-like kinase 1 [Hibiscus syriacus]|uniref:Pollen receptor-like kinase 1 n=1 Tax=Hibiscus syriacus TaxID=106335 RepID=A0A6A2YD86_HIBSY|nr:Pollen receptor-like kinase 1 [Hibiscus syriacus]